MNRNVIWSLVVGHIMALSWISITLKIMQIRRSIYPVLSLIWYQPRLLELSTSSSEFIFVYLFINMSDLLSLQNHQTNCKNIPKNEVNCAQIIQTKNNSSVRLIPLKWNFINPGTSTPCESDNYYIISFLCDYKWTGFSLQLFNIFITFTDVVLNPTSTSITQSTYADNLVSSSSMSSFPAW